MNVNEWYMIEARMIEWQWSSGLLVVVFCPFFGKLIYLVELIAESIAEDGTHRSVRHLSCF